jgi:carbamoyltransferase
MIICGLKLTHDGAVALTDDRKLLFSIELEKIDNNPRYTAIDDTAVISDILRQNGYGLSDIDHFAVDGWGGYDQDALAIQPRLEIGDDHNRLSATNGEMPLLLDIAQYTERDMKDDILAESVFDGLAIEDRRFTYSSYLHVAGHVMSAYCTSPFARRNESASVLVWDGGMYPRLYHFDSAARRVINFGPIFLLIGNIYTIFSQHFGPFKVRSGFAKDDLSVAGKVMAYIALGEVRPELFGLFEEIYRREYSQPMGFANRFASLFKERIRQTSYSDEDILATFHAWLEDLLISKLAKKTKRFGIDTDNLCLCGGCALNIKWNSAIRNSGLFGQVYVPPFPNDSGSAIGAACISLFHRTGNVALDWSVYSGPRIVNDKGDNPGWLTRNCSVGQLAQLLHETNEPVVFLNGRAELGPRALGNRSILAPAGSAYMKDILNKIKKREAYRPVSPICLEERASEIFEPGIRDDYMLFDHRVKKDWVGIIPAVCHLDKTARLQTVSSEGNAVITELLTAYEKLSGIPLLCNTSANHNGKGFFPDAASAMQWGGTNYVWCDQTLYEKEEITDFAREYQRSGAESLSIHPKIVS